MNASVGVDLGGTNCRAALVDLDSGRLLAEVKEAVVDRTPVAMAALVERLVLALEQGDPRAREKGVGIGFAGMLRGWTGVVANAPNFGWRDEDFRGRLRARLGPAVELYNDLNAIAYGEATWGAARGARDMLCVYVGTGVGGGLVLDGKLFIGATHLAGEIGHTKVVSPTDPAARQCGCGQRGCIEAYVSGRNLAVRARGELSQPEHRDSRALALAGDASLVHAGHLDEAARDGDPYARALWAEVAPLLGMTLANAVTLVNPSRVVLGGGVWEGAPELRRLVTESFNQMVNAPSGEGVVLVDTVLGDTAGVLGAAALVGQGVISKDHP